MSHSNSKESPAFRRGESSIAETEGDPGPSEHVARESKSSCGEAPTDEFLLSWLLASSPFPAERQELFCHAVKR